jgi:GWxTD domain-containing protein
MAAPQRPPQRNPVLLAQAQQQPPAPAQVQDTTPDTPYKRWLNEEVIYIISNEERQAFGRLQTDDERQMFILQFWLRRDPTPGTAQNEYREEHYRRIAYTTENFSANGVPGWKSDRGMIYIKFGPPDEREQHPTGGTYQRPIEEGGGTITTFPFEKWLYKVLPGVGTNVMMEFVDPMRNGEYHMTTNPAEKDALAKIPGAGLTLYEAMGLAGPTSRFTRTDGTVLGVASTPLPDRMCFMDTASNRVLCWQKDPATGDRTPGSFPANLSQFEQLRQFQKLHAAPPK